MHLPVAAPELFILPFALILRKKFLSSKFDGNLFFILSFICFFSLMLALLLDKYAPSGIISTARSYLYLCLAYCFFKNGNSITENDILFLSLGMLLGWLYDSHQHFQRLIVDFDMGNLTFGTILSIPLFLAITIYRKRYGLLTIGLVVMILIFIFAGLRRIIAVFLISLVFCLILEVLGSIKKIISIIFLSILLFFSGDFILPQIEDYILDVSPQLHYRMFVRSQDSLSGNMGNADQKRTANFTDLLNEDDFEVFLPHGFYTNHTSEGAGIYNDFPLRGLIWILGLPLALLLVIYFMRLLFRAFVNYVHNGSKQAYPWIVGTFIIFVMLFLDGSFLSYSYCAPITGMCLGQLKFYSQSYYDNNI